MQRSITDRREKEWVEKESHEKLERRIRTALWVIYPRTRIPTEVMECMIMQQKKTAGLLNILNLRKLGIIYWKKCNEYKFFREKERDINESGKRKGRKGEKRGWRKKKRREVSFYDYKTLCSPNQNQNEVGICTY